MNQNEVDFMNYFEQVMLPNKNRITMDMVKEGERLSGLKITNPGCSSCLHGAAIDLKNMYNRQKPQWEEYKKRKSEELLIAQVDYLKNKDIHTKYEESEVIEQTEPPRKNLKNIDKINENRSKNTSTDKK